MPKAMTIKARTGNGLRSGTLAGNNFSTQNTLLWVKTNSSARSAASGVSVKMVQDTNEDSDRNGRWIQGGRGITSGMSSKPFLVYDGDKQADK